MALILERILCHTTKTKTATIIYNQKQLAEICLDMLQSTATNILFDDEVPPPLQPGQEGAPLTRKELGAFYTPSSLAAILSEWAIRSRSDIILEPGFGGCGFLEAAVHRLSSLGCQHPENFLYGCDIDPQAFGHLSEKLGVINLKQRYVLQDFVTILPSDFSTQGFDVVIGNPPYVSLHNLTANQKNSILTWRTNSGMRLNGRASLWAYFVLHALAFLKKGGRTAWVLPGSFFHANYAEDVRQILAERFGHVAIIQLTERMFLSEGTEERTVLLLCEDFGGVSTELDYRYCESIEHLQLEIFAACTNNANENVTAVPAPTIQQALGGDVYEAISEREDVVALGDVCKVLIGTVTGANWFFVMSPTQAKQLGLSERYLKPILPKYNLASGLQVTASDVEDWRESNKTCLLFVAPDKRLSKAAKEYIATFPETRRTENSTFGRRDNWLVADDGRIPDAFFSYMTHNGPRMAFNDASLNATNSIHRIYFSSNISAEVRKLAAISLCTTFSQLSAELEGRSYGSGVLKIEPSEAKKLRLVLPRDRSISEIDAAFFQIDQHFRQNNLEMAQRVADAFILEGGDAPIPQESIRSLSCELTVARNRRRRLRDEPKPS